MTARRRYEVVVYNKQVRALVSQGESHAWLSDSWADIHYVEVEASSILAARLLAASRFPAHRGFVIVEIQAIMAVA